MTILKMKGQCDHLKAQAKHALLSNDHEVLVKNTQGGLIILMTHNHIQFSVIPKGRHMKY